MKMLNIAWKDTLIAFRDRSALLLMLVAPLVIALIMGLAFGGAANDTSPISRIPVVVVNQDDGELGTEFTNVILGIEVDTTEGEQPLFSVTEADDVETAKSAIETGSARGVIFIPAAFSETLQSQSEETPFAQIQVFTDPAATVSPGIVRGVVDRIATGFSTVVIGNNVAVNQLLEIDDLPVAVLQELGNLEEILRDVNAGFSETEAARNRIDIRTSTIGDGEGLNLLNYFVPSMAIFFLMFAVFDGTRSILEEEREGTLHRLMSTPTPTRNIVLGKILGTFMTGILQFIILVLVSGLVFGVDWGKEPLGMTLMVLATVSAATSLGAFVASFARNINQAGVIGSVITLVSAILGGNFIDFRAYPEWLNPISRATINRWALEGFFNLAFVGETLAEVTPNILVLFGMAAVFFTLSVLLFNRRFVA